jgi:hypothetical protein
MKRYGLKIGSTGIEFASLDERDKALRIFTRGVNVKINSSGIRYAEGDDSFGVYERDTKEILVLCKECNGLFGIDSCGKREYPRKHSWENQYGVDTDYICDACFVRAEKAKKLFEAKKLVETESDE